MRVQQALLFSLTLTLGQACLTADRGQTTSGADVTAPDRSGPKWPADAGRGGGWAGYWC